MLPFLGWLLLSLWWYCVLEMCSGPVAWLQEVSSACYTKAITPSTVKQFSVLNIHVFCIVHCISCVPFLFTNSLTNSSTEWRVRVWGRLEWWLRPGYSKERESRFQPMGSLHSPLPPPHWSVEPCLLGIGEHKSLHCQQGNLTPIFDAFSWMYLSVIILTNWWSISIWTEEQVRRCIATLTVTMNGGDHKSNDGRGRVVN